MKLKCLGCDALARTIYLSAAHSPHIVDVELFPLGLHNEPSDPRGRLQGHIDALSGQGYDAIVLAYGLCGQSTAGLVARDIPLVLPRAYDCITLFLESRDRYKEQFENHVGTYWYAVDYIERKDSAGTTFAQGATVDTDVHGLYDEYVAKYGVDNADHLIGIM